MCVSQFRDYCNASYFKRDEYGCFEKDLKDGNIEMPFGAYYDYGNYSVYYITDLKIMRRLAKQGNRYALKYLNNDKTNKI